MKTRATIGEWIEAAYEGEDCPQPEQFLPQELARLGPEELRSLEAHVETCASCAAERELAAAFEVPQDLSERDSRAVDRIAGRIRPYRRSWLDRLGLSSLRNVAGTPAFQFAAAAMLLVVVGFGIRSTRPPELGEAPTETVVRSSSLDLISPVGEIAAAPFELVWSEVEGATSYAVTVLGVDGSVLEERTTTAPRLAVSELSNLNIRTAVVYTWSVEAFGEGGSRIAWSAESTFRVRPGSG